MRYKKFQDIELSALGFGCMRLPKNSDAAADINEELAAEMFRYAYDHGVNYFDTAWGYHDHNSEPVVGKLLKAFPRDSFYLATKFPGYDLANFTKLPEIFEEQLKRLGVDYFDFYLCHNVTEKNIDAYLDPQYGVMDYLREQKKAGRIRHLGFSCHGQQDVLERFVEAYEDDIEFCQIQLNYLDWSSTSRAAASPYGSWSPCAAASLPTSTRITGRSSTLCAPARLRPPGPCASPSRPRASAWSSPACPPWSRSSTT